MSGDTPRPGKGLRPLHPLKSVPMLLHPSRSPRMTRSHFPASLKSAPKPLHQRLETLREDMEDLPAPLKSVPKPLHPLHHRECQLESKCEYATRWR